MIIKRYRALSPNNASSKNDPLHHGLKSYWPINQGSGTRIIDVADGFPGTTVGSPTWGFGQYGNELRLNGSNQYIDCGQAGNFERTDKFSYSVWIKLPTATPSTPDQIIGKVDAGFVGQTLSLRGDQAGDPLELELRGSSGTSISLTTNALTWVANKWTHVVMTYDGSSTAAGVKCYIDGVEKTLNVGSDNLVSGTILNTGAFKIGALSPSSISPFDGWVKNLKLYDRVIPLPLVIRLYGLGPSPLPITNRQFVTLLTTNDASTSVAATADVGGAGTASKAASIGVAATADVGGAGTASKAASIGVAALLGADSSNSTTQTPTGASTSVAATTDVGGAGTASKAASVGVAATTDVGGATTASKGASVGVAALLGADSGNSTTQTGVGATTSVVAAIDLKSSSSSTQSAQTINVLPNTMLTLADMVNMRRVPGTLMSDAELEALFEEDDIILAGLSLVYMLY